MSLLEFSQIAGIVGVIAVIGSLIYVGLQLRQNTIALHAQSRQSILEASVTELHKALDRPDLMLAITKQEALSPEENADLSNWYTATLRARMFAWLQFQDRIIDADQWNEECLVIQIVLSSRRGRIWWQTFGSRLFTAKFAQLVDDLLRDQPISDDTYQLLLSWSGNGGEAAA